MITELETRVLAALQSIFDQFGWAGVAALMAFENATGITPSEIILGLAGWLLLAAHDTPFSFVFLGGLYAAGGSIFGASLTYWLARLGGRPVIDQIARWFRLDPVTYEFAKNNLTKTGYQDVILVQGNGALGFPDMSPYDRIAITAASRQIPAPLIEQLAAGGKLIGPFIRRGKQFLVLYEKDDEEIREQVLEEVLYVRMRDPPTHPKIRSQVSPVSFRLQPE